VQPAAQELAFLFRRGAGALLEALDRRFPTELLDEVLLGAVTTYGRPMGRQPCETSVRTSMLPPSTNTPTAPSSTTRSSSTRRFPPGLPAEDARPPMIWRPGRSRLTRCRKASTGNVNGSAKSSRLAGGRSPSDGQPVSAAPSGVSCTRSVTGVSAAPSRRAAKTVSAGFSSISCAPPATATAVPPTST